MTLPFPASWNATQERRFETGVAVAFTEGWAKEAFREQVAQPWSEELTVGVSAALEKRKTFERAVTVSFSEAWDREARQTFQASVTVSFSEGWVKTVIVPVVENVSGEETTTGSPPSFEGTVNFDAGDYMDEGDVEYREWDENGVELTSGYTFHETVSTTPNTSGYSSSRSSDQCHELQFRVTPKTSGGATGTAQETGRILMSDNSNILC